MATILQVVIMRANQHWTLLPWFEFNSIIINLLIRSSLEVVRNTIEARHPVLIDSFISFATSHSNTSIQTNKKHAACRITAGRIQGEFHKGGKKDNEEYLRTRCRSFFSSLSITSIRLPVPLPVSESFGRKTGFVCILRILRNRICIVLIFLLLLFLFFVPIYYNTGRYVGRNLYGKDFACGK